MKILLTTIIYLVFFASSLFCGDVAIFVNMGFSKDSKYFMFAQYGVRQTGSGSYADLYFVDVNRNVFAPHGQKSVSYDYKTEPGTFGMGALFNIIEENIALKTFYRIDHLRTGRILYHLMDGDKSRESFGFRDFITGNMYTIMLSQSSSGNEKSVTSSFGILFTIQKPSGTSKTYTAGHPGYERNGVKSYRIRQIILSPDSSSLVFVIEKEEVDSGGSNIRYMIETVSVE
jgi:predicted secreted protein